MKKIKALLYCTKAKPYLYKETTEWATNPISYGLYTRTMGINTYLNGTIPCECEIEVEELPANNYIYNLYWKYETFNVKEKELLVRSCLDHEQLLNYLRGYNGYALHISNLKVFDKPRELSEYVYRTCLYGNCSTCKHYETANCSAMQFPIKKAPQNMMYAFECIGDGGYINLDEVSKEPYILISIQPQHLVKILNGEKDIEIRKQVLNCMKGNE